MQPEMIILAASENPAITPTFICSAVNQLKYSKDLAETEGMPIILPMHKIASRVAEEISSDLAEAVIEEKIRALIGLASYPEKWLLTYVCLFAEDLAELYIEIATLTQCFPEITSEQLAHRCSKKSSPIIFNCAKSLCWLKKESRYLRHFLTRG